MEPEVQQCDGRVHTSQQNQEVPSTNPYPLQMLEESLCNLMLSGSQSHALSITHRNSVFQLKGFPGLSSQINFLTCETRIRELIDIKAFKIHCLSANCYFPCENQKLIFLCVCLYFIVGTPPIPGEHELHRMERHGMAHCVREGFSLSSKTNKIYKSTL